MTTILETEPLPFERIRHTQAGRPGGLRHRRHQGIGAAIAHSLASQGATSRWLQRTGKSAERFVADLKRITWRHGPVALAHQATSARRRRRRTLARSLTPMGDFDILVNNAAHHDGEDRRGDEEEDRQHRARGETFRRVLLYRRPP